MRNLYLILVMVCSLSLTAQNTYNAPASGDLVVNDCNGILYDAGGPDAPYANNSISQININGTSGDALALTFTFFDLEPVFDELIIYGGPTLNSPLIGVYSGDTAGYIHGQRARGANLDCGFRRTRRAGAYRSLCKPKRVCRQLQLRC